MPDDQRPEDDKTREQLVSFYQTMAEQLNSRLSESPRFFAIIVVALTAYAYVISRPETGRFLLALVSLISYVVLLWSIWYLAALGYAFRFLQYPMHKTDEELGWNKYALSSGEIPKQGCSSNFWLLPGIYHAHLAGLLCILAIVCLVFGFKWWNTKGLWCPHWEALALSLSSMLLGLGWAFFISRHYLKKYEQKIQKKTDEDSCGC